MCAITRNGCFKRMQIVVRGVEVRIGFWFAFAVCYLLSVGDHRIVRFAVLFSLLHECGHLLSDCSFGKKPRAVSFGLFGMTIRRASDLSLDYRQEIRSALAGPFVNLLLFALLSLLYVACKQKVYLEAAAVNASIFLFNMMPVFSLDGGRAFEAFLKLKVPEESKRLLWQKGVSLLFVTVCMGFGFSVLFMSGYNFSLLLVCLYLVVMLFLKCGT